MRSSSLLPRNCLAECAKPSGSKELSNFRRACSWPVRNGSKPDVRKGGEQTLRCAANGQGKHDQTCYRKDD
jgi:hypothetical protein